MKTSVQSLIQRIIINTSFFPFIYFYEKIYDLSVAVAVLLLRRVGGVLSIYLRRGVAKNEIIYGLSDIDLLVIVKNQDEEGQLAKEKVKAKYDNLSRFIPLFGRGERELGAYSASEFLNLYNDYDFYRHWFNEGKYSWKLLFGKDVVKTLPQLEDFELYLPVTEELKVWWSHLKGEFTPDFNYPLFKRKYLWYKAISEAAKIYLFICHGKNVRSSREAVLCEVKNYLSYEHQCHIDKIQGYLRHLTSEEDLIPDELIKLFIALVSKTFEEMERKVYGDSKGKTVIVNVPSCQELIADSDLADLVQESEVRRELEPYLDSVALIPQAEFNVDVLDNSDIDSFYLVLVQRNFIPIEKLKGFLSLFGENSRWQNIEPFIVAGRNIALSLQVGNPHHCIKSPRKCPLFFSLLPERASKLPEGSVEGSASPIHCYLPPDTFEETIKKRIAKINAIILDKNIYKMKTLDFLRFFWGAARTKLLAHSLQSNEVYIPLTSRQILEMLLQAFPEDSDWLKSLHIEYTKELLGKENEAYRFFSKSIAFLNHI